MKDYRKAKKTVDVSVGDSVRIIRELQELSQTDLAELIGRIAGDQWERLLENPDLDGVTIR